MARIADLPAAEVGSVILSPGCIKKNQLRPRSHGFYINGKLHF
jgi:hypothetical protein